METTIRSDRPPRRRARWLCRLALATALLLSTLGPLAPTAAASLQSESTWSDPNGAFTLAWTDPWYALRQEEGVIGLGNGVSIVTTGESAPLPGIPLTFCPEELAAAATGAQVNPGGLHRKACVDLAGMGDARASSLRTNALLRVSGHARRSVGRLLRRWHADIAGVARHPGARSVRPRRDRQTAGRDGPGNRIARLAYRPRRMVARQGLRRHRPYGAEPRRGLCGLRCGYRQLASGNDRIVARCVPAGSNRREPDISGRPGKVQSRRGLAWRSSTGTRRADLRPAGRVAQSRPGLHRRQLGWRSRALCRRRRNCARSRPRARSFWRTSFSSHLALL